MKIIRAAATSAGLSALFLVVYLSCNWITSRRVHVNSVHFAWEQRIPFVPLFIIPYLSIDLFFVLAPFLAKSRVELRTFALRMVAAILLAGTCYLLFPLKFAFERQPVSGFPGFWFNIFRNMDLPFNQCPSLHITLLIILSDLYIRRTTGVVNLLIKMWFSLILLSPLLIYQHHVADILGGFFLAIFCFYLVPGKHHLQPFSPNIRVGLVYTVMSILVGSLAFMLVPWTCVLLLPASALAITAVGYLSLGPAIYSKTEGKLSKSTRLILWPVLIGQRLSALYYAKQCHAYDRLTENVWIGRRLSEAEARQACADGVTAVVDLTSEFSEAPAFRALHYLNLPVLDLTAPHSIQIDQAVAFIQEHEIRGIIYVHCKAGYSRTAVIAGAYLLETGKADTVKNAIEILRLARPSLVVRPEAIKALEAYQARRELNLVSSL